MFGQRFESIHSTVAFIAALNEEEGIGATISELSEQHKFAALFGN